MRTRSQDRGGGQALQTLSSGRARVEREREEVIACRLKSNPYVQKKNA